MVIYYILYFNSMYKFALSFMHIMKNSQIDESDIMILEIYGTAAFATLYLIYGGLYATVYKNAENDYYGVACCGVAVCIYI